MNQRSPQVASSAASTPCVIVFARAPVPGRCKTRLAGAYGARGAARIYRQLVRQTLNIALSVNAARVELWCEPKSGHGFFVGLRLCTGVRLRRQPRGDLGRKMSIALRSALASGANRAVLIGTDCLSLTSTDLQIALDHLDSADTVLQPATDGGFVLIGAKRLAPGVFTGVVWSSGVELQQSLRRLQRRDISYTLSEPRWDIDTPTDVRRARRQGLLRSRI